MPNPICTKGHYMHRGEGDARTGLIPDALCDYWEPCLDDECASCGEASPEGECPKSRRSCGHHCNHVWTHDACDWCCVEFGEDPAPSSVPAVPVDEENDHGAV